MEKHEVVIVGAGPGGLTAAKELAFKDKDVLVLEKRAEDEITRNKLPTAAVLWASEGENIFPESVYDCVVPVMGDADGVEYTADIFPIAKDGMIVLNRERLSRWQLKEAKRFGSEIRDQSPVLKVKKKENKVVLKDGKEIGYDYLIGADGGWSLVKKSLGIKERHRMWGVSYIIDDDTGTFIDHYYPDWWSMRDLFAIPCGRGRMAYTTFYSPQFFNTPFDRSIAAFKEHFEKWLMEMKGFSRSDIKDAECKISPAPWDWNGFKYGNVFLIGDAMPSFAPFFYGGV